MNFVFLREFRQGSSRPIMFIYLLFGVVVVYAQASRCSRNGTAVKCSFQKATMPIGRDVWFQTPLGTPPAAGWPAAIFFQGSFAPPWLDWDISDYEPFGAIYQIEVFKTLLDAGFAVIAPAAPRDLFWETNIPPYDVAPNLWFGSSDHQFLIEILNNRTFGADPEHLFAFGISSGGYQSSRVAIDMAEYFRAVVVASGAYMTCGGVFCFTPKTVPPQHPPTLFLHGLVDPVVPYYTMEEYHAVLVKQKIPTKVVTCDLCVHQWIPQSPQEVLPWFRQHFNWTAPPQTHA